MSVATLPNKPNTLRRWREVRDVFNKLRKKYRADVVYDFIRTNYFMDVRGITQVLQHVDKVAVTNPSLIYQAVMRDDFNI